MSCYTIYYNEGRKMMRPVTSREEYLRLRNSQKQIDIVDSVRGGDDKMKHRLLQMNYSCLPGEEGALKGCTTASDTVGMDIDHIGREQLAEVRERILARREALGLLMLERSARGEGFHLVFRRRPELSQEENLRWASELLGVEFDKGAKDITRVFFATTASEEDLIFLDEALFACEPLVQNPERVAEISTGREPCVEATSHTATAPEVRHNSIAVSPLQGSKNDEDANNDSACALSSTVSPLQGSCARDLSYLGIPYADIISKWWAMYNDGQTPVKSNRDVLTFELAVNLRHICGFDREVMDRVIPCYDGFSHEQKMKCIDSALGERRTQMPKRLKDVIDALKRELLNGNAGEDIVAALEQADAQDLLYHYDRLPKLPQGVRDSIDAAGHPLAMPTLIAIAPAIGALATGVKLDVHGTAKGLNLCSFVVGEFASGKGQLDGIIAAWMTELQMQTDIYTQQEEEWAQKTRRMKSGKAPEQPKLPVRMLTLNNTVANIAERLSNTEGKHSFSFTPEADNVALKWKQSVSDFSVMLRQAYDEARYDREAKSADAVRVHIQKLLWNVTMCGTQDALYRVITNYTDGLLSRIAIGRTPDNTFAPLAEHPARLNDRQSERIQQIAHLLPLMEGTAVLPKLEERGRAWLETIRLEAMKNDDRVLARQRMRGCVNAQRITTALWLPKVAETLIRKYGVNGAEKRLKHDPQLWVEMLRKQQTEEMLQLFDIIADYLLDNDLYFFRERIEAAYESKNYHGNAIATRGRKGKNDSIFARLASEFSFEQALQQSIAVKGVAATHNSVRQMLKNWKNQGLVSALGDRRWRKVAGV